MNEKKIAGSKRRKITSATVAIAMALTMLLSGTLAYFYRSSAVNVFSGQELSKEVIGHDDFNEETGNKDIYVENVGTAPVYVRVKLTEDFSSSEAGAFDETTGKYPYKEGYSEITTTTGEGDAAETTAQGEMVHSHLRMSTADQEFHQNYFAWTMGSEGKSYLSAAATDQYGTSKDSAVDGKYIEKKVAYDPTNDGNQYAYTGAEDSQIKQTPDSQGIITSHTYYLWADSSKYSTVDEHLALAKARYEYKGWVEHGGWYYWTQPLKSGESTGILLDQVDKKGIIAQEDALDYEYHIHVDYEAVTDIDIDLWRGVKTEQESGDAWNNSGTFYSDGLNSLNGWYVDLLLSIMQNKIANNSDQIIQDLQNIQRNPDAAPVVVDLCKQALIMVYEGNAEAAIELKKNIQKEQAEYEAAMEAYENSGTEGNRDESLNPDGALLTLGADGQVTTTGTGSIDQGLGKYLIQTFGEGTTLSKQQAKAITEIRRDESKISDGKIGNLAFILNNKNYFSNLQTFYLVNAKDLTIDDDFTFPASLKTLNIIGCTNVTKLNVSNLSNLTALHINSTGIKKFGLVASDANGINFGGTDGFDKVNKQITVLESDVPHFSASKFPRIEKLWTQTTMTSIDLKEATHLSTLIFINHNIQEADFSVCPFTTFIEGFNWDPLKRLTRREDQTIPQAPKVDGKAVIVRVVDSKNTENVLYYERVTKEGVTRYTDNDEGKAAFDAVPPTPPTTE